MLSAIKGFLTRPATKTYYVSTSGSDSNNGLSTGAPFATSAAALAAAAPGSTILFQRGGVWTSQLAVAANNITIDAYGTGKPPRFDGGTEPTGTIFNDGFESETSSFNTNWGGVTSAGGSTITVDTTDPINGAKSMQYTHASNGTAYVTKTISAVGTVYIQFKVKIDTLVTASDYGHVRVLDLRSAGGDLAFVYLSCDATPERGVQVEFQDGFGDIQVGPYYQQGQTLRIEALYDKTAGITCWVNGIQYATTSGSNGTNATTIRLGNSNNNATGLGVGTVLLFDDVYVSASAIGTGTRANQPVIVSNADSVVLQNFEVRNAAQFLVTLHNSTNCLLNNLKLHYSSETGVLANIGGRWPHHRKLRGLVLRCSG